MGFGIESFVFCLHIFIYFHINKLYFLQFFKITELIFSQSKKKRMKEPSMGRGETAGGKVRWAGACLLKTLDARQPANQTCQVSTAQFRTKKKRCFQTPSKAQTYSI